MDLELKPTSQSNHGPDHHAGPIIIYLLGAFRVLQGDQPLPLPSGGKAEVLLCWLAIRHHHRVAREILLAALWPEVDPTQASLSLSSLLYKLNRRIHGHSGVKTIVIHTDSYYRLHPGVQVDIDLFHRLADRGNEHKQAGNEDAAMASYRQALELYQGDLSPCAGSDTYASVERAHLRSRYLTLLSYLAEYHFKQNDYTTCLHYARLLIRSDPCREDAFRLTMRCYVRCGERAQALRQFELCRHILSTEFNAVPEAATVALFDQIRLNPESV